MTDEPDASLPPGQPEPPGEPKSPALRSRSRGWRRILRGLVLGGTLLWVVIAWGLHRYGQRPLPSPGRWDAIVVLGCRVFPDGRPSFALSSRVRAAAELFMAGRAETIVLTGGVGEAGVAEAEVAATLAESLGVPRSALVLETRSTSTEQNARFAAEAIEGRRVLVVTDAYHALRSERVFARYFDEVRVVGTMNPRWWPRTYGALREVAALLGYAVQGRL